MGKAQREEDFVRQDASFKGEQPTGILAQGDKQKANVFGRSSINVEKAAAGVVRSSLLGDQARSSC